jgi:hypothetical protein
MPTVSRSDLWKKFQFSNFKGKCFKVIFNMYQGIKSRVKNKECQSDCFPCLTGVRQSENISPFLFSKILVFAKDHNLCFVNIYIQFPQITIQLKNI